MNNSLSRLFRLRPEEVGLVLVMGCVLAFNAMSRQVTEIFSLSGLLSEGGPNQVLVVWLIDYLIILLVAGAQSLLVDRVDRITLMKGLTLALAGVFVLMRLLFLLHLPPFLTYGVLYILAEQQFLMFPLIFWVLANDVFEVSQTKRIFPLIASWSFAGIIIGTGITAISPSVVQWLKLSIEDVLLVNVLIYLVSFGLVYFGLRSVKMRKTAPRKAESVKESLVEGWNFVKEVPSFRFLILSILLMVIGDVIIEFRFINVTEVGFPTQDSYQRFYSLYRMGMTVVAIIIQTTLASRVIERLSLKRVFFLYPATMLLGALCVLAFPMVWVAILTMASLKLMRDTIDESSRKSFQALVPEERRGRVSTFMDSYLPGFGTVLACLIALGVVGLGNLLNIPNAYMFYLGLAAIGSGVALFSIYQMHKAYDVSLLNWRLKRRQRAAGVLDRLMEK